MKLPLPLCLTLSLALAACAAPLPSTPEPTPFDCPVTAPNGMTPPGEDPPTPEVLGNEDETLWTGLWPEGKVIFKPGGPGGFEDDGAFSMKFWWWRKPAGDPLTLEGRRLDGDAGPLRAHIPEGYSGSFQSTALIFPTPGCWEVTGRVNDSRLTFVTEVVAECPADTSQLKGRWAAFCAKP